MEVFFSSHFLYVLAPIYIISILLLGNGDSPINELATSDKQNSEEQKNSMMQDLKELSQSSLLINVTSSQDLQEE
jgi:hypothetical protein